DPAHQRKRQIWGAVVGVTEQALGYAHIPSDVSLALYSAAEKQIGYPLGGLFKLKIRRRDSSCPERLREQVHSPHDGVLAVLRRGHFHGLTGVYLQNDVVTGYFTFYLRRLRRKGGEPSARRRGGIDASDKAVPVPCAYAG